MFSRGNLSHWPRLMGDNEEPEIRAFEVKRSGGGNQRMCVWGGEGRRSITDDDHTFRFDEKFAALSLTFMALPVHGMQSPDKIRLNLTQLAIYQQRIKTGTCAKRVSKVLLFRSESVNLFQIIRMEYSIIIVLIIFINYFYFFPNSPNYALSAVLVCLLAPG